MKRSRVISPFLMLVAVVVAIGGSASGQQAGLAGSLEHQLKAAFIYRVAQFVEWPPEAFTEASGAIVLCALGDDPLGGALESIRGKIIDGKRVAIERPPSVYDLRGCHILFVSSSERQPLDEILEFIGDSSVLTIGEVEGFAESGGIINFVIRANRIRLEINVDAAERARLELSSRLLRVAEIVSDSPPAGEG